MTRFLENTRFWTGTNYSLDYMLKVQCFCRLGWSGWYMGRVFSTMNFRWDLMPDAVTEYRTRPDIHCRCPVGHGGDSGFNLQKVPSPTGTRSPRSCWITGTCRYRSIGIACRIHTSLSTGWVRVPVPAWRTCSVLSFWLFLACVCWEKPVITYQSSIYVLP